MRARLQAEERARQAFLGTASHELRTPLASLQATRRAAGRGARGARPTSRAPAAARRPPGARPPASGLATDLLDLSRVDGEVQLRREPIDLPEIAAAAQAESRRGPTGPGSNCAARARSPRRRARHRQRRLGRDALGDERPSRGSSACCSTTRCASGGGASDEVEAGDQLSACRRPRRGTRAGERERIFGRFERGSASERPCGFGLGLPMARELARRMGGDLEAEPAERGATFA